MVRCEGTHSFQELRGRNVNEGLHTPFMRQLPQGLICVQSTVQT